MQLKIIWRNDHLIAVDKPAGFFSHPPEDKSIPYSFHKDVPTILTRQIGSVVYPLHRLDRATSGILLLSLSREKNAFYQQQFQQSKVKKKYLCLVRGRIKESLVIDSPLAASAMGLSQPSKTLIHPIYSKLCFPQQENFDPFVTLLWAEPETGRYHQIRRHLARISHPIAGDGDHGDKKWNRRLYLYLPKLLFLRSMQLEFETEAGETIKLENRWGRQWHSAFDFLGFCPYSPRASSSP